MVSGNDLLAKLGCFVLQLADLFFEGVMNASDRTQMEQALVDGIAGSVRRKMQRFLRPNDMVGPGLYHFVPIISAQGRGEGLAEF